MNLKVVLVFLALSLITICAVAFVLLTSQGSSSLPPRCPSVSHSAQPWTYPGQSQLFADLSREELTAVMSFLTQQLGPGLVDAAQARPSDNCVFSVELQLPPKAAALAHLDRGRPPPAREALAIVLFGGQAQPNVSELVVGPLPHPTYMRDVTLERHRGPLPYHRRPMLRTEYVQIWKHLKEVELPKAPVFLASVFNYNGSTLAPVPATPRGLRSGDRATWLALYHNISGVGIFLHPVGLELLLDHRALDPARWAVQQVFYLGRYYADLGQLEWEFKAGQLEVVRVPLPLPDGTSSLRSRISPGPLPPLQFSPQGSRYTVQGNLVASSLWTFTFGHGVFSGMRIFDIRFKGERVAYEVSVQECMSVYGADSPKTMMTRYLDSSYGLGRHSRGLVRGVDCPYQSTMVDIHILVGKGTVQLLPGAVCIFEEAQGLPLRRHHNHLESHFYGGLASSALVVRSVSSVGNYDYIWDFVMHPNGALEGRVHATGYINTAFLSGGEESLLFGNRVGEQVLGTVHTHAFHFKLDLDVAGLKNWVVVEDVVFKPVAVPWSPEHQLQRPQLTRQVLGREDLAAFSLGSPLPRYFYLASNQTNAWGHQRGYRIQIHSPLGIHVPLESDMERAVSWGRYQLVVTQRKEEESQSSSIYYQNDIWTPSVAFADFINNETLLGEDLVAWVTASFLHIPHAEDVPNTLSPVPTLTQRTDSDLELGRQSHVRTMNQKTTLVLLALAVITIFVLVCVLLAGRGGDGDEPSLPPRCPFVPPSAQPWTHPGQSQLFADLGQEELMAVMSFLTQQLGPGLVDAAQARPSDNCVFSVELQLPPKAAALAHLDKGRPPPAREALAIVLFGGQAQPNVSELVVGPLPHPTYMRDVTLERHGGPLPYHRRPMRLREYQDIDQMIFRRELPQVAGLLHHCCFYKRQGGNLVMMITAPPGLQSGDRATWLGLYYNISGAGIYLHPVGLELLVDHKALDPAHWTIQKVFFQGRYYESLAQLEDQFEAGLVNVLLIPDNGTGGSWSLKSHVPQGPAPPLQFYPQGPRFSVQGSRVASSLWTFSFGLGAFSGPRVFDIRFQGERIAYEVSVQEALTVYGGNSPAAMLTRYMDGSFGLGKYATPLTRGVDCPYLATYVDWHFLLESQAPKTIHDAFCVFEQNQGLPLRRHHSDFYSHYFGGLTETVLVIRSVSTLLNYDYVWDMIFHPSGALEVRFHATGYISSAFLFGAARKYGNQVGEHTLGTVHTHSAHFKVDLDVGAGLENWVWAEDMAFVPMAVPWSPEHQMQRLQVTRKLLETEEQAAFPLGGASPRYLYLASNHSNKWGHPRGYRIQMLSFAGEPLPQNSSMESAFSWGRYQLAVTQRKEEEPSSTSIYNQYDPWAPTVDFTGFINNETIAGEDLVAWVTAGFLHIPHAEDIPNTVTVGNGVGFFLRPYNFFDQDPSFDSADSIYFQGDQDAGDCEVNPLACLPQAASCAPDVPAFSHGGFSHN
ncbi:amine oxidase [copper-containing] 3 isoform X1 [Manis javanica]|uniref:amine oxidase [copper-containing] 3 isoform X1 n=2 Tax=Manis javanica TaxID=9974 RepID=UPI003C6D6DEF